jgi:hypothetical protein
VSQARRWRKLSHVEGNMFGMKEYPLYEFLKMRGKKEDKTSKNKMKTVREVFTLIYLAISTFFHITFSF